MSSRQLPYLVDSNDGQRLPVNLSESETNEVVTLTETNSLLNTASISNKSSYQSVLSEPQGLL